MKNLVTVVGAAVLSLLVLCVVPGWALEDTVPITLQSLATADGEGTTEDVSRFASVGLDVTITNTATVTFKARSSSGGTFTAVQCTNVATGELVTTATATMHVRCNTGSVESQFKAPITDCSSCTVTVAGRKGTGAVNSGTGLTASSAIIGQVGFDQTTNGTSNGVYNKSVEPCADQTNLACRTVGGPTRIATFSSVTSATTSAVLATVNTGVKTFFAYMGGASETKAFNLIIYGNWQNSTTGGRFVCNIWVPSTASVTHIEATCPEVEKNFPYWYYTAEVYTSASATNLTVYALH